MKIYKVTGVLFSNERGFEVKSEEFDILDQNEQKIIVKDADFTTVWKNDVTYGDTVDKTKFDSSYEPFGIMKGVGFFIEEKNFDKDAAVSVFAMHFETKIKEEILEREKWLTQINKVK